MKAPQRHKDAEIASRTPELLAGEAHKPFAWGPEGFLAWAVIERMLADVRLYRGARIIDVGAGAGWTSLFLAEMGYEVTGYDLVPANVEIARERVARVGAAARFEVADMERLPPGEPVDGALIYDALHHVGAQPEVLAAVAARLKPGGWLLLGEPTWLHRFSPSARDARRTHGWLERGISLRTLKRDLRSAGFGEIRRYFGPTEPYQRRGREFAVQLVRLVAANAWVAPHTHLWIAAQRADGV